MTGSLQVQLKYQSGWEKRPEGEAWSLGPISHVTFTLPELAPKSPDQDYVFEVSARVHFPPQCSTRSFTLFRGRVPVCSVSTYSEETSFIFTLSTETIADPTFSVFVRPSDPVGGPPVANPTVPGLSFTGVSCTVRETNHGSKLALIAAGKAFSQKLFGVEDTKARSTQEVSAFVTGLVDRIANKISERTPFSLVRFSDGEGRVFAYPQWLSGWDAVHQTLLYQFGPKVLEVFHGKWGWSGFDTAFATIREGLIHAARNADVLGVPAPIHFAATTNRYQAAGQVGFASVLLTLAREFDQFPPGDVVDCYCHHSIQRCDGFREILTGLPFVGIIGHTDLGEPLRETFGIEETQHIPIPGHASFMSSEGGHFPARYEEILATLKIPFRGAVYLVGAGYLGKMYCDAIKQRGGIALDVGSVFDGWSKKGRPGIADNPNMQLDGRSSG